MRQHDMANIARIESKSRDLPDRRHLFAQIGTYEGEEKLAQPALGVVNVAQAEARIDEHEPGRGFEQKAVTGQLAAAQKPLRPPVHEPAAERASGDAIEVVNAHGRPYARLVPRGMPLARTPRFAKEGINMSVRAFALIYGVVFIAVGVAGFIPALVSPHDAVQYELTIEQGAGDLFGLFPINVLHNIVHLAFGAWGLAAYRGTPAAIGYARVVAMVYAVFVLMGFVPGLNTVFGLVPLHGNDLWLHALLAAGAGYFGFIRDAEADTTRTTAARGT
jgi:Domain of unknown function (DUF4383)